MLCARVCVSLSLFFLCVRNMDTKAETQKKMERAEKKKRSKKKEQEVTAVCLEKKQ